MRFSFLVQVKKVRQEHVTLEEQSKGETKEGAKELLTLGDLQSHRKMFNLIKNTFPEVTVSTPSLSLDFVLPLSCLYFLWDAKITYF